VAGLQGISPGEEAAWRTLAKAAPEDVCRRTLARYEVSLQRYVLKVMGDDYEIAPQRSTIKHARNGVIPLDLEFRLMVLSYLTNATDAALSGRLVECQQLRGGDSFFRGVHRLPVQDLEARFGESPQLFRDVCLSLDGRSVPYGDVAVEVRVLPKLPLTFVLWVADDEFPARVSILFDSTADEHLPLDALLAAVRTTAKRIVAHSQEG